MKREVFQPPTSKTRKGEPRRAAKSAKLLTREQRVQKAVEIIGKDTVLIGEDTVRLADIIEAELLHIEQERDALARHRLRNSEATVDALTTLGAALRRAKAALPYDFRVFLGIDQMIWNLEVYEATLGKTVDSSEKLKEWLEDLEAKKPGMSAADKWKEWLETKPGKRPNLIDIKPGKPKPDAYEKRLAAGAALHLLETCGIRPTSTKTGKFCRLTAVLYGDPQADLQHHCQELLPPSGRRRKAAAPRP